MSGISINSTSASAVALLTGSTSALERTNRAMSTGKDVSTASDNAAYWAIAKEMSSATSSMSTAVDANALAQATADAAALGTEQATNIASQIRDKLILAKSLDGAGREKVNVEISQLKEQLSSVAEASSFNGQNWLSTSATETPGTTSLVAGVVDNGEGTSVETLDFDTNGTNLVAKGDANDGVLTKDYSGTTPKGTPYSYHLLEANSATPAAGQEIALSAATTNDEIDGMIGAMDQMSSALISSGARLGATMNRLDSSEDFMRNLKDVVEKGISKMVDADMEETATRMAAQKAQVQLQTIGLNIANQSSQQMLTLFM